MNRSIYMIAVAIAASIGTAPAWAGPSANQICAKMISEGRGGSLDQKACLCTYRVADAVLDNDVKALLFDAWYTGKDNMPALARLDNPQRVKKQLRTMQLSMKANCE